VKLAAGLDAFGVDPAGFVCLDVGASTGGFTQVLLERGASRVYAVDVGRDQLHPRVARDPRVVSLEGTDARRLDATLIPDPVALLVADVSFISLRLVLPAAVPFLQPGGWLVALVKPQFEAGREDVRKGLVRDAAVHRRVCDEVSAFVAALGFSRPALVPSPIAGGDGNLEFLLGARRE
jgi:23S rRNA (cytidine1920-2'-O)/16S rRNA (cytidine1409-2'-O)-methyltransferase